MGSQSQQPVFYDADMGQYYTQAPQTKSQSNFGALSGGSLSNLNPMRIGMGGERTYLNDLMNKSSPALQQAAPYEYADVSLASLFPMLQGAMQNSQGGALSGLLGATGQASSGAGRFL